MCYELPSEIMQDHVEVVGGANITDQDAAFAAQLYPLPGQLPYWKVLDHNPSTVEVVATKSHGNIVHLYQRRNNEDILKHISNTTWPPIDSNSDTAQIVADGEMLYQRHNTGRIFAWKQGDETWTEVDGNHTAISIVASAGYLYQLYSGESAARGIRVYNGTPNRWTEIDCTLPLWS